MSKENKGRLLTMAIAFFTILLDKKLGASDKIAKMIPFGAV